MYRDDQGVVHVLIAQTLLGQRLFQLDKLRYRDAFIIPIYKHMNTSPPDASIYIYNINSNIVKTLL